MWPLPDRSSQEEIRRYQDANVIRETRPGDQATQQVGIYIGPQADYITAAKNILEGNLKSPIVDESHGGHNQLAYLSGR